MAVSISARVAWDSVPPTARVDMAPLIAAIRSASASELASSHAARKPASNASPAPVASTASTG